MQKLNRTRILIGAGLLALALVAAGATLATGREGWLLLLPAGLLISLTVRIALGLRGSRGGLSAFRRGQFPPRRHSLPRTAHLSAVDPGFSAAAKVTIDLCRPAAQISERFLSVAVDLSQVVGGKWWDPAADHIEVSSGSLESPVFNFNRPQLDRLTSALAPLYLRIGGSASDRTFYSLDGNLSAPPGYQPVLTRRQWDSIHAPTTGTRCSGSG